MTAIVEPIGSSTSAGVAPARNMRGSVASVTPAATQTVVSFTAGTRRLRGFSLYGTTDALAWIEVDGSPLEGLVARHSRVLPAYLVLPNPEAYPSASSVVALRVLNEGTTSSDFEGVIFGE